MKKLTKKLATVLILSCIMAFNQGCVLAETNYVVKQTEYKFSVNEEPITEFPAFNINGQYYIPVDYAAEFYGLHTEVDTKDSAKINIVEGNSKDAIEKQQKFMAFVKNTNRKVEASKHQICYAGNRLEVTLLDVDKVPFMSIKDVAAFGGIFIITDDKEKTIDFSTDSFRGVSEEQKKVYKEYLIKHAIPVQLDKLDDKALIEKAGLNEHQILLYGEHHATVKNFEMELFLIKYLNQNEGIRHIFIESGYCDAQLLNRYLATGDESILKGMMNNLKGTFAYSQGTFNFYKSIYEYNKTLPEDKKLELIGVDVQHQTPTGMDYIISLLPEKEAPETIKAELSALQLMHKSQNYRMADLTALLKSVEETHKTVYKDYLGTNYEAFNEGLISILQLFECDYGDNASIREKKMIENFTKQYQAFNQPKCFGIFGGAHTDLNQNQGEYNLATYINTENASTKGKVGSITAYYFNSFYMDNKTGQSTPMASGSFEKLFAETVEGDLSLVPLCKESSIFIEDGSTQSQQYIVLIKDSAAPAVYSEK